MSDYKVELHIDDNGVVRAGRGSENKESEEGSIIFVTIGVPFSNVPIMQKVMLWVNTEKETEVQVAKNFRKQVADNIENHGWVKGTKFTPAELYYEIYRQANDEQPYSLSPNSPRILAKTNTWYTLHSKV